MTIDLERRASLLGESLKETIEPLMEKGRPERLQKIVEKFGNRERLAGVAVYDVKDKLIAATRSIGPLICPQSPIFVTNAMNSDQEGGHFLPLGGKEMYLYALPLHREESVAGALVIIHDPSYIQDRLSLIWKNNFIRFLGECPRHFPYHPPFDSLEHGRPDCQDGGMDEDTCGRKRIKNPSALPSGGVFEPLTREVTHMAREYLSRPGGRRGRSQAQEHRLNPLWTPARLKEQVRTLLQERPLFVISNREPYMHEKKREKD